MRREKGRSGKLDSKHPRYLFKPVNLLCKSFKVNIVLPHPLPDCLCTKQGPEQKGKARFIDTFPPAKLVKEKTITFDVYLTPMSFHT